MKLGSKPTRSLIANPARQQIHIIDQTMLPFSLDKRTLSTWQDAADAIRAMRVRGAPLIGVTAAYGLALAMSKDASDANLQTAFDDLLVTRPTAVNLEWALKRMLNRLDSINPAERVDIAWQEALAIENEDIATNLQIGHYGFALLRTLFEKHQRPINVLTHCNAGRMACIEWGTATAPIYLAKQEGLQVHVWVEETRPRNQGLITAWELGDAGVAHTYLADNAGGHLMQHGKVDVVIVGADRVTARGDVANKVGTYLKALAANDNNIPFYVAAPTSTVDLSINDGLMEIMIEERNGSEIRSIRGLDRHGMITDLRILPDDIAVTNPGFDVTPARLVTGLITERGIVKPDQLKAIMLQ